HADHVVRVGGEQQDGCDRLGIGGVGAAQQTDVRTERLAAAATTAAGLACNPWRLGKRMSAERAVASVAGAPSTGAAAASSTSRMTLRPASTRPVATVIPLMRSRLVTSTCVSRLGAERAMRSASKEISGWPAATRSPWLTRAVKPLPFRLTVSTPM